MNRRNFILGLGTAATLSGAASVTGAAFSGSTSPGADFRVLSTESLTVQRSSALTTVNGNVSNTTATSESNSNEGYVNASDSFVDQEGNITYNSLDASNIDAPALTVDGEPNDGLNMSLVTPNNNDTEFNRNASTGGNQYFTNVTNSSATSPSYTGEPVLEVVNNGSSTQDVGVQFNYGGDVDGSDPLSYGDVNQLFTFVDEAGNRISPDPSDNNETSGPAYYTSVSAGDKELIGVEISYTADIASDIAEAAGFSGAFGSSGSANADLLDSVLFGVDDGN